MKVGDLLRIKGFAALTIRPDATIADVSALMRQEKIGALVVSSDGKTIEGIISERDIAFGLAEHRAALHTLPVSQLMTREVVTCGPDDSLAQISKTMTWKGFRHVPVVDGGELKGIISIRDVLRNRIADLERVSALLRDYMAATD